MINRIVKAFIPILIIGGVWAQTPEEVLASAEASLEAGDIESAENGFKEVLQMDPTYAPAMIGQAHVALRKGDLKGTQEFLKQAIEADPENQEFRDEFERLNELNTLMSQGQRAIKNGDLANGYDAFANALEKFPQFAEAAYSMGLSKFRMKDYMSAVEHFYKALEIYPLHETARAAIKNVAKKYFNEGNTAYKRGDLEGALEGYNKVLNVDETFYQANYQIGVINSKMGDKEGAIASYQKALEVNPNFYKGWFALGLAQSGLNEYDSALDALQKAVDIHPGYEKAYGAMGDIYIQLKDYDNAKSVLRMATQVNPNYARGFANLAVVYLEEKNLDDAISNLTMATTLNRKDSMSWFRLANAYNSQEQCDKALEAARTCTEIKSRFGGGWLELGVAEWCKGKGNKTAAVNALEKARNDRAWRKMAEYELDKIKNPQKYEE